MAHSSRVKHNIAKRLHPWGWWPLILVMALVLAGCNSSRRVATPTATPLPPTARPTFTPIPTATVAPTATPTPAATATPTTDPNVSPLTGLPVADPALVHRRVLAVRVGNDPEIRPQEGLGAADLVYEEIMDGWSVTRFTALYLESEAERIRPLRSARLSGLEIVPQYDAAYAHTGASDGVRWRIAQASFVNLDEYFAPAPFKLLEGYDWRGRMYTSTKLLRDYLSQKGLESHDLIRGYTFDSTPPTGTAVTALHIPYPSSSVVDWAYDADSGRYLRSVQGKPHLDGLTDEQIAADNVIVLYAEHLATDIVEDTNGATAIDIVLSGSGRAQIFRDGVMIEARWVREAKDEPIQYYDERDRIIPLHPGKTWIELVPTSYEVQVQ